MEKGNKLKEDIFLGNQLFKPIVLLVKLSERLFLIRRQIFERHRFTVEKIFEIHEAAHIMGRDGNNLRV